MDPFTDEIHEDYKYFLKDIYKNVICNIGIFVIGFSYCYNE